MMAASLEGLRVLSKQTIKGFEWRGLACFSQKATRKKEGREFASKGKEGQRGFDAKEGKEVRKTSCQGKEADKGSAYPESPPKICRATGVVHQRSCTQEGNQQKDNGNLHQWVKATHGRAIEQKKLPDRWQSRARINRRNGAKDPKQTNKQNGNK